jgi:hypothetical protein
MATDTRGILAPGAGFVDQAHFINDFKAGVGRSPRDYAASARR